ncbi:MAG: NAD-dependent epimerase/dehydratase family protein [Bacteroidales bacterium]
MRILVTGVAGFIASRVMYRLLERGEDVVGIDNINNYYDVRLKYGRLKELGFEKQDNNFVFGQVLHSNIFAKGKFIRMNLEDKNYLDEIFEKNNFDKVINLAAQAGVRYSITNPYSYLNSNIVGFLNILERCRNYNIKHLVYASSSSVYGLNEKVPYSEDDKVDNPVSLYAATKKSNELMAHAYCKLYAIKMTGLRYFTVYGPWGRPDMSPMLFAKAIQNNETIQVFNNGDMIRDFTYIDDIVEGTIKVLDNEPKVEECVNNIPYKVYNIGCSNPVKLMDFIAEIEQVCGKSVRKVFLPMQPGDVYQTNADTSKLEQDTGYKPRISLHEGIQKFMQWYQSDKNPLK